jgi:integrase
MEFGDVKFYTKRIDEAFSYIFVDISYKKNRLRLSTGYTIKTKNWHTNLQRVTSAEQNYIIVNAHLTKLKSEIDSYISGLMLDRVVPEPAEFENKLKEIMKPKNFEEKKAEENKENNFLFRFNSWIEQRSSSNLYSKARIQKYKAVAKHIKLFEESKKTVISVSDLPKSFLIDFANYLVSYKGLKNNTIITLIKIIKTFLKDFKSDFPNIEVINMREFRTYKDTVPYKVVLEEKDIRILENIKNLPAHLETTRKRFLLQIDLLVRISDFSMIKPEHINKDKRQIQLVQVKTGDRIMIPITNKAIEILENWDFQIPKISEKAYRENIKKVCQLAGFTDIIEIVSFSGNNRVTQTFPKFELISTHTARRTGITKLIRKGVPIPMIMKITGHKKVQTLMTYVGLTDDEITQFVLKALE